MMYRHTRNRTVKEVLMAVAKIAITLEKDVLSEVDRLVRRHVFPNRSRAIQEAVREKVTRLSVNRLARECAKLDARAEQALAEEGMSGEVASWPEY
jgi:Arc/MetJ-type ribon-helix-helix transcriptional regulator